jgi:hypothetical protein
MGYIGQPSPRGKWIMQSCTPRGTQRSSDSSLPARGPNRSVWPEPQKTAGFDLPLDTRHDLPHVYHVTHVRIMKCGFA